MSSFCWCAQYSGEYGNMVHLVGKRGSGGDCVHYVVDTPAEATKDAVMRGHTRDSFVRVSSGLTDMAVQLALPLDPMPLAPRKHVSAVPVVTISCEHKEDVVRLNEDRTRLMRIVEELLEGYPDADIGQYSRKLQAIRAKVSKKGK